ASALIGYFAMTYSPMEIPVWSIDRFTSGVAAIVTSGNNPAYVLGGLVMGPLFGLLGHSWRVRRSWVSATVVGGALCLEPLARWATGQLWPPATVWRGEVALGALVASMFALMHLTRRRSGAPIPRS